MADAIHAEGYNVTFEFISPGSPQYNGVDERMFATLFGTVQTMLNEARVPMLLSRGIWAEAACTAIDLRAILCHIKVKSLFYEKFMGEKKYDHINTLHTFSEMAIVEDHATRGMRGKLQDHGKPAMFVGTTHEHMWDTYRFLRVTTNRIIMSRNVVWTGRSYGEHYNINPPQMPVLSTRLLLNKQTDGLVEAREVMASPGFSDVIDEPIDGLSDEDEDDFMADKKIKIQLKKCVHFAATLKPPPCVTKPSIQNHVEPGRVPWAV
jgi:hypothetical protein